MHPKPTGLELTDAPRTPLPPLPPASRELLEILWSAGRPLRTRQIHHAVTQRHPHRAGRKINTTSSLLASLLEVGWVIGCKRGGTRWVYDPAVSRDEGMRQLARLAAEAFSERPGDGWYLVGAALSTLDLGAHGLCAWTPRGAQRPSPSPHELLSVVASRRSAPGRISARTTSRG